MNKKINNLVKTVEGISEDKTLIDSYKELVEEMEKGRDTRDRYIKSLKEGIKIRDSINNLLLLIIVLLITCMVSLFTVKKCNAKSVTTTATVPEYITIYNSESVRQGREIIYFKL